MTEDPPEHGTGPYFAPFTACPPKRIRKSLRNP